MAAVRLNGREVPYESRLTNRGLEFAVEAAAGRRHVLAVRTG